MTSADLITIKDPRSAVSEAYRGLRTNLLFSSLEKPVTTVVITSPAPEDRMGVALANLAVTMAQGGKKTILIDGDLRKPALHTIFGVDRAPGLSEFLLAGAGSASLVDVGVEGLSFLPAGALPPNPADLLGSARFETALASLKAGADVILLAAPPVIAVTDAALLAHQVDGVLLVMQAGKTRRDDARKAKDMLERVGAHLVGVVLLDASGEARTADYYGE